MADQHSDPADGCARMSDGVRQQLAIGKGQSRSTEQLVTR
jgi:hypothetical protein